MRRNVELALIGLSVVYLSFFSWPVPRVIKDILHTGVGRLVGLLGVAYLAKEQSVALAILAAIFYVKSSYAAYHENFEVGKKDEKKPEAKKDASPPPATSGNVPASSGSSASAQPASPPATEHFGNFAAF